jgi:uncharacterized protein YqgC (DUF456 family)
MDWVFITIGILLVIAGLPGAVIPGLPGPLLSFIALVLLQFTKEPHFSIQFLVIMGLIMAVIFVLDWIVPVYGTKRFGGSKQGIRGSTIGLIIGVFVLPLLGIVIGPFGLLGIILGPFIGAYLGEKAAGKDSNAAFKSAIGSFIGFLAGTLMKLIYSVVAGVYFFIALF